MLKGNCTSLKKYFGLKVLVVILCQTYKHDSAFFMLKHNSLDFSVP